MFRCVDTFVLCALLFLTNVDAARILAFFPTPSISHQVALRPITQELARRGHKVTLITTDPSFPKGQTPENLTEIDVHDLSYKKWYELARGIDNGENSDITNQLEHFANIFLKIFELQTQVPEVQEIIKNKNNTFDLLIVEALATYALGFAHVLKVPVITMTSMEAFARNYAVMGAPVHPILYPDPFSRRLYNLSLWEKLSNIFTMYSISQVFERFEKVENEAIKRIFGEDTPPMKELLDNVNMMFVNVHPIWGDNRPMPPGVINIGGIHQKPQKELPQDLQKYLDSSKHGVIYISFGTNVETSLLPPEKVQAFINAFSKLPYDVLWKWNQDVLPGQTKNIKISKWFPQSDLLRHPKVKLFITQGGLQSTDEAITAGVPFIGIPMLADQWFNVEKYEHHKMGIYLKLTTLDTETVKNAIETVIGDSSYRENVVRMRTLMNDQPMSSLERAVWWTEHALRHGGTRHLRAPAANMTYAEYYEMDLVLTVLGIAIAAILSSVLIVFKLTKLVYRQFVSAKVKTR